MIRPARPLSAVLAALALAACASAPPGADVVGTGTVLSVTEVVEASRGGGLLGSIGGALAGAGLGSLIGGGTGRSVATGVGAAVGSSVGGQSGAQAGAATAWDVLVRFDDGIDRRVRTYRQPAVRPGTPVSVSNGTVSPR
ncbi:MAG TPA: glycine zipper 2TM domain-containing protein [Burkholderiaceae bacterium]|nr:glycine zipper 2TM domain-containing protein [Burkholderiaceae bacterium]